MKKLHFGKIATVAALVAAMTLTACGGAAGSADTAAPAADAAAPAADAKQEEAPAADAAAPAADAAADAAAETDYPTKGINVICPWGAGGGTDACLRAFSEALGKELGQTLTGDNQTGGGGILGHQAIADADPDGYTFGMITFELSTYDKLGTPLSYENYDVLCRVNTDAAAVTVNAKWAKENGITDLKTGMKVAMKVAAPFPDKVDGEALKKLLITDNVELEIVEGGMLMPGLHVDAFGEGDQIVIVNVGLTVYARL